MRRRNFAVALSALLLAPQAVFGRGAQKALGEEDVRRLVRQVSDGELTVGEMWEMLQAGNVLPEKP